MQGADPLGAQPHLAGGLLAGDDQRRAVGRRRPGGPPRAAAWTCRRRAHRRPAAPPRGRARRRARGRTPAMPVGTARAPASSTSAIGRAGAVTGPADTGAQRRRRGADLLRGCPRPGTRGSGRPTWRRRSRTRSSGGRDGRTSLQRAARGDANRRGPTVPGRRRGPDRLGRRARAAAPGRSRSVAAGQRPTAGWRRSTGMVTSPAFSKVRVTSRYCPVVSAGCRPVSVIVRSSRADEHR